MSILDRLQDLDFLYILPVTLLQIVAAYASTWPIKGHRVGKIRFNYGEFYPSSVACSENTGELLVLGSGNVHVRVYSVVDMRLLRTWGQHGTGREQLISPNGVCVDEKSGHVIVVDTGNHRLQEFHLDGTFIRSIGGGKGSRPGELNGPQGVSMDTRTRLIYVSEHYNHRISVFSLEDGRFIRCFGSIGSRDDQLKNPSGIHFDEVRQILFIADFHNHRVKLVNPDGSLVGIMEDSRFGDPIDVTVDSSQEGGDVYVVDTRNRSIHIVSLSREYKTASVRSFGYLHFPSGACRDHCTGRLFVTEWGNNCISIFE